MCNTNDFEMRNPRVNGLNAVIAMSLDISNDNHGIQSLRSNVKLLKVYVHPGGENRDEKSPLPVCPLSRVNLQIGSQLFKLLRMRTSIVANKPPKSSDTRKAWGEISRVDDRVPPAVAAAWIIQALKVGREKCPVETECTKDILAISRKSPVSPDDVSWDIWYGCRDRGHSSGELVHASAPGLVSRQTTNLAVRGLMLGGLPLLALIHMYAYLGILASWLKEISLGCKGRVLELNDCSFGRRANASPSFPYPRAKVLCYIGWIVGKVADENSPCWIYVVRSAEFLLSTHLDLGSVGSIALRVDRPHPNAPGALIVDRVHPGHLADLNLGSVGSIALRVDRPQPDAPDALVVDRVHPGQLADLSIAVLPGDVLAAVDRVPLRRAPLAQLADALRAAPPDQRGPMQRRSFRRGSEVYAVDSPRQFLPGAVLTCPRAHLSGSRDDPCRCGDRGARLERASDVHDRLYIRVLDHEIWLNEFCSILGTNTPIEGEELPIPPCGDNEILDWLVKFTAIIVEIIS
jgi:hypothetical protein